MMKDNLQLLNWQINLEGAEVTSIGNDLMLLEKPIITSVFDYPFKIVDITTACLCLSGRMEGLINLKQISSSAPSLTIVLPDQILQYKSMSKDFTGYFIVMSNKFINSLSIQTGAPLFVSIRDNPVVSLTTDELKSVLAYFSLLKEAIKEAENPYQMETIEHLTKYFFYGTSYRIHKVAGNGNKSKHEVLTDKFLSLVKRHYREERSIGFYAERLQLTPKYLSSIVKAGTGKFANEWIDSYVILEAEALLKSTNMTIQQISDDLNFPTQSVFGKYFKRLTGKSPRDYKNE